MRLEIWQEFRTERLVITERLVTYREKHVYNREKHIITEKREIYKVILWITLNLWRGHTNSYILYM